VEKLNTFLSLANKMDVEATDLGEFTDDGNFTVMWGSQTVSLLPLEFLHGGLPRMRLKASWKAPVHVEPILECPDDLTPTLLDLLSRWNICSKESLVRQYDHEVQAGSVIKPLVGITNDGPGDAAVIRPVLDRFRGVAVGCGIAPRYSDLDTYHMMACVVDEAVRNILCVGADPDHMAGLDNFCWCDPVQSEKTPDGEYKLAQLVRANMALYDICKAYSVPCISGKDSMKNDYSIGDTKISIPPTVLFTAVGVVPDVRLCVTPDFKNDGDLIYVLGLTKNETGASEYLASRGLTGNSVPKLSDPLESISMYRALHDAIKDKLAVSVHDLSDGGLAVALAESCFSGGFGADVSIDRLKIKDITREDEALFSESPSRFLVSIRSSDRTRFENVFQRYHLSQIGYVCEKPELIIRGLSDRIVVKASLAAMKNAWQAPLGV
jgi:phosphoribosylformylglycinamidine synthase